MWFALVVSIVVFIVFVLFLTSLATQECCNDKQKETKKK
jgi:hypothetical protein